MLDLIIRQANTAAHPGPVDIACRNGEIVEVGPAIEAGAAREIDASGNLVTPPFIDSHFHMDAALSFGQPRVNESGTLLEGIELWGELKPLLTIDHVKDRAHELLKWAIGRGTLVIRTHVDICDPRLLAVQALVEVREEIKPYVDLQLVAFPQDGLLRDPGAEELLIRALDMGVDVVGGIPHFERTMAHGAASVTRLCEIAAQRGLLVDMHCDETDDPMSRHIETLCHETLRLGLQGRVCGSHLTSMHSMDNYYVSKLLPLMAEAQVNVVSNPCINILIQGRHDTYPKRRGLTRVKEMYESGINVSFGHDCVMDPWYSLGSQDMLEVAHMAVHVGQLSGIGEMNRCFDSVTTSAAKNLCLEGYGLEKGCKADMVILQATDRVEAIRLKAHRLAVIKGGHIIAQAAPLTSTLNLNGQSHEVDYRWPKG